MHIQISKSSERILAVLLVDIDKPLFINEIIRKTSLYPNSVQSALKTLKNQEIVLQKTINNKKFYYLNQNNRHLTEILSLILKPSDKFQEPVTWMKVVNRDCSVALNAAVGTAQCHSKYIKKFRISPIEYLWYNSVTGGVYISKEQIAKTGFELAEQIKKDSNFAKFLAHSCTSDGEKLISQVKMTISKKLPDFSDKQLYFELKILYELFLVFMPYFNIPHSVESAIETELESQIFDTKIKDRLLEPVDMISEEQLDELGLASSVKLKGWREDNKIALVKLTEKYCWLPMMALHNNPFDIEYFKNIINDLVKRIDNPTREIKKLKLLEKNSKKALEQTFKEINADKNLVDLVYTAQAYIKLRTYRINIIRKFHYYHLPLLAECSKRIGISPQEISFLTYQEILDALSAKIDSKDLISLIKRRQSGFANLTWKGKSVVISGVEKVIHAMEQYKIISTTPAVKKEIHGNPACKGLVTGRVKIVTKLSELDKVVKGNVLVARMTTPDYMIAINKAVAIVTDEGGITCHAAIVSREFNIPCIVGTRNATQVLSDNDLVEVDANSGVVKVIESFDIPENIDSFPGKTIFKGKVRGRARIILDASDFSKFENGDIIIAPQTTPEYLSLLYRAKGFVVDEESITSHAVLYGRALKLPSIMGTSFARNALVDGELVELDSTGGFLTRLKSANGR